MGAAAAAQVDESSYRHYLDDELYTHYGDNRGFGPEHDLARNNIAVIFSSFGLVVRLHAFEYSGTTYYNVVATKLGTLDPTAEYIVGAHYDSVENPGAVDDASGVAVLLESARILSKYDSDYTIRFIAFDREEQGMIGSRAYAQGHLHADIRGMIELEHTVFNYSGFNAIEIHTYGQEPVPLAVELGTALETYADGVVWNFASSAVSDHWSFTEAGFQACVLGPGWGNHDPHHHGPMDSVDTPDYIDYEYGTKYARTIVGFLVDHARVAVVEPVPAASGRGLVVAALLILTTGGILLRRTRSRVAG
jgi:Zn-dependent M28 family amino/carboxypeptidase